ncbi:MAG: tRNA (adenosine(37)-N6)-threonylcarbamoyltransferase complex ATPase subunit type 1 TsaE [Syntrophaceae bacterium]
MKQLGPVNGEGRIILNVSEAPYHGSTRLTIISKNPTETNYIGKIIGEHLIHGDIVALIGELGTGKTSLTQGIARGLGVPEEYQITSPSFTLINEYHGRATLYHFDLYRLKGPIDLEDLGYDEYISGNGVNVIEWADKIINILPDNTLFISFTYINENERELSITGEKEMLEAILKVLKNGGM